MSTKPKKAPTKTKEHVHVSLPNGAIVKVSPDCPKKTMDALREMTDAIKRLPKNWGKVRNHALDVAIDRGDRLAKIAEIIEAVDHRAMCCDGDVTPTKDEITTSELVKIYKLAKGA